ncbi:MAG: MBL fold metallo-hydrolase RNA specificity domain-containing protein [Nitrososphaerales archaeon]
MGLPDSHDPAIGIYKPRALKYDKEDGDHYSLPNVWSCEEIKKGESKVILAGAGPEELIDIAPKKGLYLHGTTEAFDEAGDIDEQVTMNWIEKFGMIKVHSHCSGHASGMELVNIVNRIAPKEIIPIHTTSPSMFETFFDGKVRLVERNQKI